MPCRDRLGAWIDGVDGSDRRHVANGAGMSSTPRPTSAATSSAEAPQARYTLRFARRGSTRSPHSTTSARTDGPNLGAASPWSKSVPQAPTTTRLRLAEANRRLERSPAVRATPKRDFDWQRQVCRGTYRNASQIVPGRSDSMNLEVGRCPTAIREAHGSDLLGPLRSTGTTTTIA